MSFPRLALLGVISVISVSGPAAVRASAPAAAAPALRDSLRAVWEASPEVRAARAQLDAARARARAADRPLYNPTLSVEAENADVDRRTAALELPLDLSGKRRARAEEGAAVLDAAEAAFDTVRRDVAGRWLKAWSAAALAQRQTQFGRRRLELMQRFDALAADRLKVGDISLPERDLAGLALGEAQVQQAALVGNEAAQRAALAALVGDDAAPAAPELPEALPPDGVTVIAQPVAELAEMREARAQVARSDAAIAVARRNRIPDPTISLRGGRVQGGPAFERVRDRVIGLTVSIPLPLLNDGRAEVDAAQADADAAAAGLQARELALHAAQRESRARYDGLRDAVAAFRGGRAGALEDRAALLEKIWRAGEMTTSDYLVQLKQSLDTALSGLDLESRAWQAWFDYLAAAGRLTDWIDGTQQDSTR